MMDRVRRTRVLTIVGLVAVIVILAIVGYSMLFGARGSRVARSGEGTGSSVGIATPPTLGGDNITTQQGAPAPSKQPYALDQSAVGSSSGQQLVVRTASVLLRVDDIDGTIAKVRNAVAAFKGQIDDLQVSSETNVPIYYPMAQGTASSEVVPLSAYVTVRVPSARLAEFSAKVASFGKVLRESANQADVTQQRLDMAARLANLRAEEVRLRAFLDAAKNVKDMLAVEQELSRVRGEIESMQSQLDYLDKQISYGTITIELQKPAPVVRPTGTDWGFAQAITDGIQGAAGVIRSAITALIALSPLFLLVALVWVAIYLWIRRRRRLAPTTMGPADGASTGSGIDASVEGQDGSSSPGPEDTH